VRVIARIPSMGLVWLGVAAAWGQTASRPAGEISVAAYRSVQDAIDANPGRMLFVPPGDHTVADKVRLRSDRSGLYGPGRIVQTNPGVPIVEIERGSGIELRGLTLTRPEGKQETRTEGVLAMRCRDLVLDDLRVVDNRTCSAAIALRECVRAQVRHCLVLNYMRISIDDRTGSDDWGYAFHCIDGSGIAVTDGSLGTLIEGNRVIEENLLPTPEVQKKFGLGKFSKKNPRKGTLMSQKTWDEEYVNNWHQGSAIVVTSPTSTDYVQILGNTVENAAQGIDIHADHVIVAQNIVNDAFMGMKAMHGSRHVLIVGNQFSKSALWAIGLMPGAASHAGGDGEGGKPVEPNVDGGSIIAQNIISDFGYGKSHWIWGGSGHDGFPILLDRGQKPTNPTLADVLIQGNVVYDTGRDGVLADGKVKAQPPRYKYAVRVTDGPLGPKGVHFSGNLFHPGTAGVANVELKP